MTENKTVKTKNRAATGRAATGRAATGRAATGRATTSAEPAGGAFSTYLREDAEDDRMLKSSLWVAAGVHALLLLVNFPLPAAKPLAEEPRKRVIPVLQHVYEPPPPKPETPIPKRRERKVAVPDKTPDDPEPIHVEEPKVTIELPDEDPTYFPIPEAPPLPEPRGPFQVGGDVSKPVKVHAPPPQYTEIARRARIQGVVVVQAIIDKNGDVANVRLLKGLPMGLGEEAVKAVKTWKFKPATLNGKPVDVYYTLTVHFGLS